MQRITQYHTIMKKDYTSLEDRVYRLLQEGWQPFGGMQLERNEAYNTEVIYIQTMVKYATT